MKKDFKTIEEQIKILKAKNITIVNKTKAHQMLEKNNYYYLINGYKDIFLDKLSCTEKYIDNTKIEEIYALYNFDRKIKINFLKYLLMIESEIDTYIAYEFSKSYGSKEYLNLKNFNNSNLQKSIIKKFIDDINLEIQHQYKNSNKMIIHYIDNYQYIPLWVLVRILSFGKISRFYSLMKPKEQNAISRKYNLKIQEFRIILHNLTLIRNICAHGEKLYDIRMKQKMKTTEYHKRLKIKNEKGNYQLGTQDLFSIVIALKMLLEKREFINFYKSLILEIQKLESSITTIEFKNILERMGFPKNYRKLLKL